MRCSYNKVMKFEWNTTKHATNIAKHKVSFEAIHGFDWHAAVIWEDRREDYGEIREVALGPIGDRLYACVFTDRGSIRRIISLRRANRQEVKRYMREINV